MLPLRCLQNRLLLQSISTLLPLIVGSLLLKYTQGRSQTSEQDEASFERQRQSRTQRPRSFWLATGIATSGQVQLRKSAIHGLPVTVRMLRVKSDKSDWFWSRSIVFTKPFKTRMSLDLARGPDFSSACQKGPLGTGLRQRHKPLKGVWGHAQKCFFKHFPWKCSLEKSILGKIMFLSYGPDT